MVGLFEKTVKIDKNAQTNNTVDIKSIENFGMYASVVIMHFLFVIFLTFKCASLITCLHLSCYEGESITLHFVIVNSNDNNNNYNKLTVRRQ